MIPRWTMDYINGDKVERVDPKGTVKVGVNLEVPVVADMDEVRGKHISRPVFIKIAVDFLLQDMKKSKKGILHYANTF